MNPSAPGVHPAGDAISIRPGNIQPVLYTSSNSQDAFKSPTLNKHQSNKQRKMKIFSSVPIPEPVSNADSEKHQRDYLEFIREHFKQKECNCFIPQPGQSGNGKVCKVNELKCHCGETLSMHNCDCKMTHDLKNKGCSLVPKEYAKYFISEEHVLTEHLPEPASPWNEDTCFTVSPTTTFGKIDFNVEQIEGKKPAKYIRLSSKDSVDKCLEMMRQFWNIMEPEPPNLVISVIGGAKNFKLSKSSRNLFSAGLKEASRTTKAWLITSGFNMGVMKSVGQAVHEGQTFQWNNNRVTHMIRCIGIAPWGYVKDRKNLEGEQDKGRFNAPYNSSYQIEHKKPVPLNPDHTHFIFVDDGYRSRYAGVAEFRSEFERKIAQKTNAKGVGIPVVVILVEGGIDAIQDVKASLNQQIPVVICSGTGRAADVIAYAYKHTIKNNNKERFMLETSREKLKNKISKVYEKQGNDLEKLTNDVVAICQKKELIKIFDMNKDEELDVAILSVLLKVETKSSYESQLQLAITWNRADIAQEKIFREDSVWNKGSLEDFLTEALIEDKVEFVKLLLDSGIIMRDYLTIERLECLYNSISEHSYLYQILKASSRSKGEKFKIKDISNFLKDMLDKYDDDEIAVESKNEKSKLFNHPFKQLLIWAVLMNRFELASLFLKMGKEPIVSALICTALCLGMENKVPRHMSVTRDEFHNRKNEFEKIAIDVLDECHNKHPDQAIKLVEKKSSTWSQLTSLQIAVSASDQTFVSSGAAQNSINNIWKSGIMSCWLKVLVCAFIPFAILRFVEMSLKGKKIMSNKEKILTFYSAPLTKFAMYTAAYVAFLILFTYMISVDYGNKPSLTEWVSIVWIFSFFIGKIYAYIVFPSPTYCRKLRDCFSVLETLAFLNLVLALCAFCIRWNYVTEGKIIYCVNAIVFYVTLMKFYTADGKLGPKIYMIKCMLRELVTFIMVLAVFLLAYGVASQGLLYKRRQRSWGIFKDVLYFPYWQLFGELFLEELETDETCTAALRASYNGTLNEDQNTCRTFHWLVPVLLALYLLIGNVLLLNLLIAIFSHVFDTVEKNAIEIWKFQMYFLVMDFQNQPPLVPPLSLFLHLWHFIRWIYYRCYIKKIPQAEQFERYELEYLTLFEKEMMANKLQPAKSSIVYSDDMRFNALQTRINELRTIIEDEILLSQPNDPNGNKQKAETNDPVKEINQTLKQRNKTTTEIIISDKTSSSNIDENAQERLTPIDVNSFSINPMINSSRISKRLQKIRMAYEKISDPNTDNDNPL